jgi:hypothetical protein
MADLTEHEIKALRLLAGEIEDHGGAWLNACCGFLRQRGYVEGLPYQLTDKGRAKLKELSNA